MNHILAMPAFAISFILGIVLNKILIPILKKFNFGQNIREEGPESHLKKSGTPTMGGAAIIISMIIGTVAFIWTDINNLVVIISTLLFGAIGCVDDMLKIVHHQSEGLKAWQKLGLQFIVALAMTLYFALGTSGGTGTLIPFIGMVDLHGWFYILSMFAILGTVNGANFTDGLDGLAGSVTTVIAGFFAITAITLSSGISISSLAMAGALLAFLCFNCYPAKVFMGDTGSLALGGFTAACAFVLNMPVFLIFIALIYLVEILSVIMQVGYFKLTHGKRLFRMSPLHHHFELGGWSETRVVTIFSIIAVISCMIAYIGLYVIL